MNFFEAQDRSRRNSRKLVLLFAIATIAIASAIAIVVEFAFFQVVIEGQPGPFQSPVRMLLVAAGVLGFIFAASAFRITQLAGGGARVAQELGGTLVSSESNDIERQRLRNVVEEMAIASGVPVPQIFVLEEESGINAFAAGFGSADAAVAVTRGALEQLDRAQLQGVIAHEFSHILNGDMRLNIRLIGVLFGILAIGQIGRLLLRAGSGGRHSSFRSRDSKGQAPFLAIGLALFLLGAIGVFMARLIRAGVSRQREYLADASAVQFTRQTEGIAGALAKIGGLDAGSRIRRADPEEVSHMLFANGAKKAWFRAMASHPPLDKRIEALDPSLARQLAAQPTTASPAPETSTLAGAPVSALAAGGAVAAESIADPERVGQPGDVEIALAAAIRESLPAQVYDAAHSREWAFYLALAIALDDRATYRRRQLKALAPRIGRERCERIADYADTVDELGPRFSLPVLELCFPALKERPAGQLRFLIELVDLIHEIVPDRGLRSFAFRQLLLVSLDASLEPGRSSRFRATHFGKAATARAAVGLIRLIADEGHQDNAEADAAFARGTERLGLKRPPAQQRVQLHEAPALLEQLHGLIGRDLGRLVPALIATVSHDGQVTVDEAELMRLVCAALDCPLPPIIDAPLIAALRVHAKPGNDATRELS